jgi:hypothetical protein
VSELERILELERGAGVHPPDGIQVHEWGLELKDFAAAMHFPKSTQVKRLEITFWRAFVNRIPDSQIRQLVLFSHELLQDDALVRAIYDSGRRWAHESDRVHAVSFDELQTDELR